MVYWNKDQLKELRETVAEASKAAIKQQEQKNCKDLAIIPVKKERLVVDCEKNSMNMEPEKNSCRYSLSMDNEFDVKIPSVQSVLDNNVSHHTHQPSDEIVEEGLDMSLLIS